MKKVILFAVIAAFIGTGYSQACLQDVWMSMQNKKIMEAKKKIDECMIGNEGSAKAWLYKGNVYLRVYDQDNERLKKNPAYVSKTPDALWIAYESFYKSMQIDVNVHDDGVIDPQEGQRICADPLMAIGMDAWKAKDLEKADKYIRAGIKCYEASGSKRSAGIGYYNLASVANERGGEEAQLAVLDEAIKANTGLVEIYTTAYDMYSKAKNLEKCKDVLAKAKKNVNEQFVIYIHLLDLGYNAEIGDTAKMDKALERIYKRDTMADIMSDAANYLLNAGMYDKAEQVLNRGLEKSPKNFSLNNMMAYGYFLRVDNIIKLRNQAITERNYELANQYKEQQDALMNNAHEWAQKAFDIQPDHLQNAKMLKQLKLQLGKEVPAELNAVIEKYTQPKE